MSENAREVPLHVQAASFMRDKIYAHEWIPEHQIPVEHELCEMLGMSRGTVRRAIKTLVNENLLVQMHGKGTFVTSSILTHPTGSILMSFAESLASQGVQFTTKVLRQEAVPADAFASGKLFVPMGSPVLMLDRLRRVEGKPILLIESIINLSALPGLDEVDYAERGLFNTIESRFGKKIGHSNARYAACVVGKERGELMEVSEDAPVLHLEQQIFLTDNTPAEWSNVWLSANKYIVGTVLQRM